MGVNNAVNTIGLIINEQKDIDGAFTQRVCDTAEKIGIKVLLREGRQSYNKCKTVDEDEFYKKSQCLIVIGGDGTLLSAARGAAKYDIPLLGANLGRLGFLTKLEVNCLDESFMLLKNGNYFIDERMMLRASIIRNGVEIEHKAALNDVAVAKGSFSRIIHLKAYVNSQLVQFYAADGLLVSSPTGSTGYSLSAGGPIIYPSMKCLLLTPLNSHALNARPIVTGHKDQIDIEVVDTTHNTQLTIDGQETMELVHMDIVRIVESSHITKLIRLTDHDFFTVLRNKLTQRIDE